MNKLKESKNMERQRKQYPAEFKVQVLREHLENQVPIGKLAEQHGIQPTVLYLWKKELFEKAATIFTREKIHRTDGQKIQKLEEKIQQKDSLISELVEDNLKMKKKVFGEN